MPIVERERDLGATRGSNANASRRRRGRETRRAPNRLTGAVLWLLAAALLVGIAAVVVARARTHPAYDPYGWLVWGQQTLHGSLDLGGAPSWKPLPFLFTLPEALTGRGQLWLWQVSSVGVALVGCAFAGRIAWRLTRELLPPVEVDRSPFRWSLIVPAAAAVVGGLGVLEIQTLPHYILSDQSDPMITALCLAAVDRALAGRWRWSVALLTLAALGRPEVWPFLAGLTVWAWIRRPDLRLATLLGGLVVAALWFGVPWLTNGRPDLAGRLAENTRQVLRSGQLAGTWGRFTPLHDESMWLAAAVAAVVGLLRRRREILLIAAGVVLWFAVELVLAYQSYPVLPRFMFEAAGLAAALAGAGVGAAGAELMRLAGGPRRVAARLAALPAGLLAVGAAAALLVPAAVARVGEEQTDVAQLHRRSAELALLQTTVDAVGGVRFLLSCGHPVTFVSDASALAWLLHLDVSGIGYKPGREIQRGIPLVILRPLEPTGWSVTPVHEAPADQARCARLRTTALTPLTGPGSPGDGQVALPVPPAVPVAAAAAVTHRRRRPARTNRHPRTRRHPRAHVHRQRISRRSAAARASSRRSTARSGCRSHRRTRSPGAGRSRCRRRRSRPGR